MGDDNMWSEEAEELISGDIPLHRDNVFCRPDNNLKTKMGEKSVMHDNTQRVVSSKKESPPSGGEVLRDFGTGATRSKDADGERYDLISPFALRRVAKIMAEGAKTHGSANWEKGVPLDATLNHLERHLQMWKMEQKTGKKLGADDHMAKVVWGAMAICHYEEVGPLNRGVLVPRVDLPPK